MEKTLAICYYRKDATESYLFRLSFMSKENTEKLCTEYNAKETEGRHFFVKEVVTW